MERLFENIKNGVLNFKLNLCCYIFSVRVGIVLFASYNLITSLGTGLSSREGAKGGLILRNIWGDLVTSYRHAFSSVSCTFTLHYITSGLTWFAISPRQQVLALIAVMTSSFPSLYMHAQQIIMEGEYSKSSGGFAYCAEICSNVLLLCGVFRKDITLLRYFTYVGLGMAAATLLVYAMIINVLDMLSTVILVISLTCQIYVVLLVRSYIVDLQNAAKHDYVATWRTSYEEPIYYKPEKKYTVVIEPGTSNDVSLADPEEIPAREIIEIIEANEAKDETSDDIIDQTIEVKETEKGLEDTTNDGKDTTNDVKDTTNQVNVDATEASTSKKPSANIPLRYPYKFVAIKIPKEKPIQEEGSSEDVKKENREIENVNKDSYNKELNKDVINEGSKDAKKPPKLPIRTIFGRKKKRKDSETRVDEPKNT